MIFAQKFQLCYSWPYFQDVIYVLNIPNIALATGNIIATSIATITNNNCTMMQACSETKFAEQQNLTNSFHTRLVESTKCSKPFYHNDAVCIC